MDKVCFFCFITILAVAEYPDLITGIFSETGNSASSIYFIIPFSAFPLDEIFVTTARVRKLS